MTHSSAAVGPEPFSRFRLQALGFDPDTDNYVANAVGICAGFYMLFFVEKVLKMALKVDHQVRVGWVPVLPLGDQIHLA